MDAEREPHMTCSWACLPDPYRLQVAAHQRPRLRRCQSNGLGGTRTRRSDDCGRLVLRSAWRL
jgi:hypothetical protein